MHITKTILKTFTTAVLPENISLTLYKVTHNLEDFQIEVMRLKLGSIRQITSLIIDFHKSIACLVGLCWWTEIVDLHSSAISLQILL